MEYISQSDQLVLLRKTQTPREKHRYCTCRSEAVRVLTETSDEVLTVLEHKKVDGSNIYRRSCYTKSS